MISTKGFNQYNWDYEIDSTNNVFGRYISYGNTEIILDSGRINSGLDISNGWNYNRWPGTTTINLPLLSLPDSRHRAFSDETFTGGVSSKGEYGVFSMKMHDTVFNPSFRANKSWFYFGDEIICLGSDIKNDDTKNKTETTLFQLNMNGSEMPFYNNSATAITDFPYNSTISDNSRVWMVDPYGNGYIVPDANGLTIERGVQESYYKAGTNNYPTTTGNYTTAFINHGTAPKAAGYEYVILPQKSPAEVAAAAENLSYSVLRKDNKAHVLKHNKYNTIGYAVFDPSITLDYGAINKVDTPVLMMERNNSEGNIVLSLSDPDLRLFKSPTQNMGAVNATDPSEHKNVHAELNGSWKFEKIAPEGVKILGYDASTDKTIIQFDCYAGINYEVSLEKSAPTTIIYNDRFDNGLSQWDNTQNAQITDAECELSLLNKPIMMSNVGEEWTNYSFETEFTRVSGVPGIAFRVQDEKNYYLFALERHNDTQDRYRIYKVVNGVKSIVSGITTQPVPIGTKLNIKITVDGTTLTAQINGKETTTKADASFSKGRVGFVSASAAANFDNVKVTLKGQSTPILTDNFENDLSNWNVGTDGTAILSKIGGFEELSLTNNSLFRFKEGSGWKNYIFEADVKILAGRVGVVFRNNTEGSYYEFRLNNKIGELGFYRVDSSGETVLNNVYQKVETDKFYHVKIGAIGDDFTASIDNTQLLTTTDATYAIGRVGLSVPTIDDSAIIDNVHITVFNPDFSELRVVYEANKDKLKGRYTDESWGKFVLALSNAKIILNNENAIQNEIEQALLDLVNAISGLSLLPELPVTPPDEQEPTPPVTIPDTLDEVKNGEIIININKLDSEGIAKVEIASESFTKAVSEAKINENGVKQLRVTLNTKEKPKEYKIVFSNVLLDMEDKLDILAEVGAVSFKISGDDLKRYTSGDYIVEVAIKTLDRTTLSDDAANIIVNRPGVEIEVKQNNKVINVVGQISIDYKLDEVERSNMEYIVVFKVNQDGSILPISNGKYDNASGKMIFQGNLNGSFAIGYFKKSFSDFGGYDWAEKQISVLASKGIINGTSINTFSPERMVKRADFLKLIVNVLNLKSDIKDNFEDVEVNSYYYNEIAIAKALGITSGVGGNKFNPHDSISRQDMMVIVNKALFIAGKPCKAPNKNVLDKYNDLSSISDYARESISALVSEGIILGVENSINPHGTTSRAEAAVVLYKILNR